MFKSKFGIDCLFEKCESGFQLTLDKENSLKLMDKIKKYIHYDMRYKLDFYNEYYDKEYAWNNKFENWGTIPVTSFEHEKNDCEHNSVYDIEVESNHNFVLANPCCDDGGIVVSNCHHMGAEVFSRCMMKLMTTYTLGLSGTMQRKDGLSKVFKMFLGDVVHKEKAESEHCVLVKGIKYVINDDDFNEVEYDYRGNPKFSTMISKLCNYNRRSEFIVEVVIKELQHNPEQQIMILAHNKTLIQYLFKAIEHKKVATVGYYLGGMKEAELKASETKKIIIATYAMASEGLDIKTLTTLIMATPKTDVCQSVGRILRAKHTTPVVIDIIDAHDLFINQWQKRKVYYKKQNYKIIVTENSLYCSDEKNGCWLTANNPKPPNKSIQLLVNNDDNDDEDQDVTKGVTNRKQPILTGMCFL
jgi:superfamily II DNA or RNA helicase